MESMEDMEKELQVHPTAVVEPGAEIGDGTKVWHFSHVMAGARIGQGCSIGKYVEIGPDVVIGRGCKIQNNVSVYKGVTLEDHVFCGPSMVFTNIFNPRAAICKMDQVRPTLVKHDTTLGANCTIVCGVTIGAYALVGAGTVVIRDVPDHALVVGNPARQIGWVCRCGERLDEQGGCGVCGWEMGKVEGVTMQLEAIYDNGRLEFVQPVELKSTRMRLMVSIPDEEVVLRTEDYPEYDLAEFPDSVREELAKWEAVRAKAIARQVADEVPELTEKQKERWEAFAFREAVRREQGRPV